MRKLLVLAFVTVLGAEAPAQECVDVSQRSETVYMKAFSQGDCAQSFKPTVDVISGAGLKTRPGIGSSGAVTMELWTTLPNQGGQMLASGTDPQVVNGEWAVCNFGQSVPVTPGVTYYLRLLNDNNTLGIQGDTANPYPDGQVYANPGYGSFPTYDYTFETYCDSQCSGLEFIKSAKCKVKAGAVKKAKVVVENTTPGEEYTCDLATGQSETVVAGGAKTKFVFKGANRPPLGPNTATVCDGEQDFSC